MTVPNFVPPYLPQKASYKPTHPELFKISFADGNFNSSLKTEKVSDAILIFVGEGRSRSERGGVGIYSGERRVRLLGRDRVVDLAWRGTWIARERRDSRGKESLGYWERLGCGTEGVERSSHFSEAMCGGGGRHGGRLSTPRIGHIHQEAQGVIQGDSIAATDVLYSFSSAPHSLQPLPENRLN